LGEAVAGGLREVGKADWTWEEGGLFELPAGPVLVSVEGVPFARLNALLLTDD
jgi:hypothetical protein